MTSIDKQMKPSGSLVYNRDNVCLCFFVECIFLLKISMHNLIYYFYIHRHVDFTNFNIRVKCVKNQVNIYGAVFSVTKYNLCKFFTCILIWNSTSMLFLVNYLANLCIIGRNIFFQFFYKLQRHKMKTNFANFSRINYFLTVGKEKQTGVNIVWPYGTVSKIIWRKNDRIRPRRKCCSTKTMEGYTRA